MNAMRKAGGLLLGAALMAGCNDRNAQTGPTNTPTAGFSAAVDAGKTSAVNDATGDWVDITGQDYQDIVRAEITKKGNTFVFVMTLADKVGDNPTFPSWADVLLWDFAIDTDRNAFHTGYPFTKNTSSNWEFVIGHWVYAPGFSDPLDPAGSPGTLLYYDGGQVKIIRIQFTIYGAKMTWVVDAASLGDPSTFQWAAGTSAWQSSGADVKNGYSNGRHFDFAPDLNVGAPLATWPQ